MHRGAELVARDWAWVKKGEPCVAVLRLVPGSYVVTATLQQWTGRAEITVGDMEGSPLLLELR